MTVLRGLVKQHLVPSLNRVASHLIAAMTGGQRRSDGVELGSQHVRDGWLRLTQAKNRNRRPVTLEIPIIPALQASSMPRRHTRQRSS
jgi:hypothetical protein